LSATALIYDPKWNLGWYPAGIALWTFVCIGAVVALARVFLLFGEVLYGLADDA